MLHTRFFVLITVRSKMKNLTAFLCRNRFRVAGWTRGQVHLYQSLVLLLVIGQCIWTRGEWLSVSAGIAQLVVAAALPWIGFRGIWLPASGWYIWMWFGPSGLLLAALVALRMGPALWGALAVCALYAVANLAMPAAALLPVLLAFEPRWLRGDSDALVVYYDGECGICNRLVRFLICEDRNLRLRYAPLGGETFRQRFPDDTPDMDALVVAAAVGDPRTASDAALRVGSALGGIWCLLSLCGALIPRPVRNRAYFAIARRRLHLSRALGCPLPTAAQAERLLP